MRFELGSILIDEFMLVKPYCKRNLYELDEFYDCGCHLFVVDFFDGVFTLNLGPSSRYRNHKRLSDKCNCRDVVGGGCSYLDANSDRFVFDNYAGEFGAVHPFVLKKLADEFVKERTQEVIVDPFLPKLKKRWATFNF